MEIGTAVGLFLAFLFALFVFLTLIRSVRIVPQARAGIVERLGRYQRTLNPGLTIVVPFVDRVLPLLDLREQVVSFPPQPVITQDNLVVSIDTVIYYQTTDPKAATYEIANYIQGIEQLTVTTLRNVIGGMDLEKTLTSREEINNALRSVLDEATGKWGIRVNRVELKAIDPPPSIKDAMEKQMRADRDKRAVILNAEGVRQSQILTAEGQKQAAILQAEGQKAAAILSAEAGKQSAILRADGESQAIQTVFHAIHRGNPDQKLLSYQYLQMLPKIAAGDANKVWIVPSELGRALEGLGNLAGSLPASTGGLADVGELPEDVRRQQLLAQQAADRASAEAAEAVQSELEAVAAAERHVAPSAASSRPALGGAATADDAGRELERPAPSSQA
jgi:regulator of protease activity HflC (stomatin/prohibitin superfamily)